MGVMQAQAGERGATAATTTHNVTLTIDGREVTVPEGTTIWEAAKELGIDIPVLCHDERLRPVGVCRLCVVDVGGRTLAASCVRPCEPKMKVETASPKVERQRKVLVELLMSDQPEVCPKESTTGGNELFALARRYGVEYGTSGTSGAGSRFPHGPARGQDLSSKVISVNHDACILCDRCVRGCDEIQHNDVIGRTGKGYSTRIGFDLDKPMGESTCVSCGECMAVCPTGALVNKPVSAPLRPRVSLKQVESVCPYCGVGCALTYHVDEEANRIVYADGRDGASNHERLCVKGRYGYDYAMHPQRLQKPLVRVKITRKARSRDAPAEAREAREAGARATSCATRTSCPRFARRAGTRRSISWRPS